MVIIKKYVSLNKVKISVLLTDGSNEIEMTMSKYGQKTSVLKTGMC